MICIFHAFQMVILEYKSTGQYLYAVNDVILEGFEICEWVVFFVLLRSICFCTCFASFRTMISKSLKDTDITIVHAKWLQSYPILCSLPGSSVHGILQARILEWVAMPNLRIKPTSSHLLYWQAGSLSLAPPWKPWYNYRFLGKRCFKLQTHRSKI